MKKKFNVKNLMEMEGGKSILNMYIQQKEKRHFEFLFEKAKELWICKRNN